MGHGCKAPGGIQCRIVIPGNNIHFLRPFEIIESLVCAHQVCGHQCIRVDCLDGISLHTVGFQQTIGIKSLIINRKTCKCSILGPDSITQDIWKYDLIKIIEGMSPEFSIPCLADSLDRLIFLLQPDTECLFTVLTVALSAVLIVDVPAGNMRVMCIAFCQLCRQADHKLPVNLGIRTGIMTLSELMMSAFIISSCHLRVALYHPCRKGTCRGCHDNIILFCRKHVYDLIQFIKIISFF